MTTAREATNHLVELLRREHHALAEFLLALSAFDRERRWVELGHNSLFSFLTRELGLSKGAAFYRNRAADLIQKYPQVIEPLRDGRLCLTTVAELTNVLTPENASDVLPRYFHLSRSEAKEVSAALQRHPAPPLRTVVTPVAAPAARALSSGPSLLGRAVSATTSGSPENLVRANPDGHDVAPLALLAPPAAIPAPTKEEPLTAELRRLHLTVSRRLLDKLAAARDALSHSHPFASEDEILEVGLDLILERHAKRRGLVKKPRKPIPSPEASAPTSSQASFPTSPDASVPPTPARRSCHIPAAVAREAWKRDQGKCQWPIEGGGICGSTCRVELDHIDGFALGGATTAKTIRAVCDFHNDLHARALYGDAVMDTYTRPKGNRTSEPVAGWCVGGDARLLELTGARA